MALRPESEPANTPARAIFARVVLFLSSFDPQIPERLTADAETARRAHLIARFGRLGSIFGIIYAGFYLAIGHRIGAAIILFCSGSFSVTPIVMARAKRLETAGNSLVMTMALGFCALCTVEGGLRGHAIAWLITVPLCALLMVGQRGARRWTLIVFAAAAVIASVDLMGGSMPVTFNPKWSALVSAGGYLGLIIFLYALGLIFEASRARAFGRMQTALKELAGSNEHLVQLNLEKNEFLGIAAHDLKNPLSVILGCAELIQDANDPRYVNKMSGSIVAAATRMRDLINDLLDANAIEEGKFASKIEPCDLHALVKQSIENNQTAATRKKITLCLGATEGLWVKADRAATLQILDNLISNALKFSPPQTTVRVHTMPEADHMVVMVRDQGPGLSEDDQKKLFGKFTRLTARPTGGESSTGLGLSIVKRLAEVMGGSVHCHSVLGSGATFSLRLPPAPAGEIPLPAPAEAPQCIPFPRAAAN